MVARAIRRNGHSTSRAERRKVTASMVASRLVGSDGSVSRRRGGRITADSMQWASRALAATIPPPSQQTDWIFGNIDDRTFQRATSEKLMELLADLGPELSKGIWDWLRLCNPGHEWEAVNIDGTPSENGLLALKAWEEEISQRNGAFETVLSRMLIAGPLRGAFFTEIGFDDAGRMPIDLYTPDPATARFERKPDQTGYRLYQTTSGGGVTQREYLDEDPRVRYVAIDPLPGSPYGRPIFAASLFLSVFMIGLLHDLRRVVAQQGFARADIMIMQEAVKSLMEPDEREDPEKFLEVFDTLRKSIEADVNDLEPDDAWVHSDATKMDLHKGAVDTSSLSAVTGLTQLLERSQVRALKSMPLLMGITDSVSEANANRQWEIYAAGIKAVQHLAESSLSNHGTLALQAQGIQARATFVFAEMRSAEELRDAQTDRVKLENAWIRYLAGAITFPEFVAMVRTDSGDPPAGMTEPRGELAGISGGGGTATGDEAATTNPEPGSARKRPESPLSRTERRLLAELMPLMRATFTPDGEPADTSDPGLGPDDADRLSEAWDADNTQNDGKYQGVLEAEVVS